MTLPRGLTLLLGLLLLSAGFHYGRAVLLYREEPPAFVRFFGDTNWVTLGNGFPQPGVHQFIDGQTPRSVIEMAFSDCRLPSGFDTELDRPLITGEILEIEVKDTEIIELSRKWMPASQRMVLKIPLHPDKMIVEDWMALPGIGSKLAGKIEEDRQKNGDFASLEDLKRVPGIGNKRIESWKEFF